MRPGSLMRNLVVGPVLDEHVRPGMEVLDLGGYDGAVTAPLANKGAKITVLDLDEEGIRRARARGLEGVVAGADAVPFPDHHFDLVVCCDLLPSVPVEIEEAIFREIGRVLKPTGVLILTTPDHALKLPFVDMDAAYASWQSRPGVTRDRLAHLTGVANVEVKYARDYYGWPTRAYYGLAFFRNLPRAGTRVKRALWRVLVGTERLWCPAPQAHLIVARPK